MSLDSSMTMMFMVPKSLKKKRYHKTNLILNSEKNLQKLWQLYPLVVAGLMMKKSLHTSNN
jgi:hypothetical protein